MVVAVVGGDAAAVVVAEIDLRRRLRTFVRGGQLAEDRLQGRDPGGFPQAVGDPTHRPPVI